MIRVSAGFLFCPMIGISIARCHEIFPHLGNFAAEVCDRRTKFHYIGCVSCIAGLDGVFSQGL